MKGRYKFSVKTGHKLFALVRTADGKIEKREVIKKTETSRLYDGYIKSVTGLYVPKILKDYKNDSLYHKP